MTKFKLISKKKEAIIILKAMFAVFLISACADNSVVKKENEGPKRIHIKEDVEYRGMTYRIIEVDGFEYLYTGSGGICPLVKK